MITATILTKNNEKTLKETLVSLKDFSEVLILDSGSEDQTIELAKTFSNTTVYRSPFLGFGPLHNRASKLATYDWILSIDSDEVLSPSLASEILSLNLQKETVYEIQRKNYFNGKWIKHSGWHPDWVCRLFHRKQTRFSDDLVHEKILIGKSKVDRLAHPLKHTPYLEISDLLKKMQHYTDLFAEQSHGKSSSLFQALFHSSWALFRSYILKRGFLGGKEGIIISLYNGHTAFYKYLKTHHKRAKSAELSLSPNKQQQIVLNKEDIQEPLVK